MRAGDAGGVRARGVALTGGSAEAGNRGCSSSDSDYDEDEPRKFYVHIKPVQPREAAGSAEATVEQLKATVGNLILPPGIGVSLGGVRRGGLRGPQGPCQGQLSPFSCRAPSSDSRPVSVTLGAWCGFKGVPSTSLCPPTAMSPNTACPCPSPGHVAPLTPATSDADPEGTLAAGRAVPGSPGDVFEGGSWGCGVQWLCNPRCVPSPRR